MAVRFDAESEAYTTTTSVPQGAYTVTWWAYLSVDENRYSTMWEPASTATTTNYTQIGTEAPSGTSFGVHTDTGGNLTAVTNLSVGTWYCFAITQSASGGTLTLYYGTDPTNLSTANMTAPTGTPGTLRIGRSVWGGEWWNGRIASFKQWSSVLTAGQIATELSQYAAAVTSGLIRRHDFLTATNVIDAGTGGNLSGGTGATTEAGPTYLAATTHTGNVSLTATPTLNVAATGANVTANASFTVNKTLTVTGVRRAVSSVSLVVNKTLTSTAIRTTFGQVNLTSTASLTASTAQESPSVPVGLARSMTLHLIDSNGNYRCLLPDYQSLSVSREVASPGSVQFDYPRYGLNFAALREFIDQEKQCEVEVWINGFQSQYRLRAIIQEASWDDVDLDAPYKIGGHFLEIRLDEARLPYLSGVEGGETKYSGASPGALVLDLINDQKARGYLTDITTSTFTATLDSSGSSWGSTTVSATFSPGTTIKSVLDELRDQGVLEYEVTNTRQLRIYKTDTYGVDKTLGTTPIILTSYQSVTASPRKYSAKSLASDVTVVGKEGLNASYSNSTALAKLGRKVEAFISAGNLETQNALNAYGQLKASTLDEVDLQVTHDLNLHDIAPMPLEDFNNGDWVWSDTPYSESKQRLQVAHWTISSDKDNQLTAAVTLNTLFYTKTLQIQRRLERMLQGSVIVGSSSPSPTIPGTDTVAPGPPTDLNATSDHGFTDDGSSVAIVTATWLAPSQNVDNSQYLDHDVYVPEFRYAPGQNLPTVWQGLPPVQATQVTWETAAGVNVEIRVRAQDTSGNLSTYSDAIAHGTETDSQAPNAPSTLTARNFLRTIIVGWNGQDLGGGAMPLDFENIELYWSTTNNFDPFHLTTPLGNKFEEMRGAGEVVFVVPEGDPYGTTYFFRAVAYDRLGNRSALSGQASATSTRSITDDIGEEVITAAKMADLQPLGEKISANQVQTAHLTIATFSENRLANGSFEDHRLEDHLLPSHWDIGQRTNTSQLVEYDHTAANVFSGSHVVRFTLTTGASFAELISDPIMCHPGDNFFFEVSTRASRALSCLELYVQMGDQNPPTNQTISITAGKRSVTTSFTSVEGQYTVPATVTGPVPPKWMRLIIRAGGVVGDASALSVWIDDVIARHTIGTAIMQDLSVTRAKIGLLAVDDGQFESASVGKLTTGTLSATVTLSGIIRTASSGARFEADSAGLRLYNSGGSATVNFQSSTGFALITGQVQTALSGTRILWNPNGTSPDEIRFYPSSNNNYSYINTYDLANPEHSNAIQAVIVMRGHSLRGDAKAGEVGAWPREGFIRWTNYQNVDPNSHATSRERDLSIGGPNVFLSVHRYFTNDGGTRRIEFNQRTAQNTVVNNSIVYYQLGGGNEPWLQAVTMNTGVLFGSDGVASVLNTGAYVNHYANVHVDSSGEDSKVDIQDVVIPDDDPDTMLDTIRVKSYQYRSEVDPRPATPGHKTISYTVNGTPVEQELEWATPQPSPHRYLGITAEQLEAYGFGQYVIHRPDGRKMVPPGTKAAIALKLLERVAKRTKQAIQNINQKKVRNVETRELLPALSTVGVDVDLDITWPNAPLPVVPDSATVGQEFPAGLLGRVSTRVLPTSITADGCTIRCRLLSGAAITAGGGQLHITGMSWS